MLAKKNLKTLLPSFIYETLKNLKIIQFNNIFKIKKERRHFLKILPKKSIGAELGVFKGAFTKDILKAVKPKELHLIDGWWKIYGEYFPWSSAATNYGALRTKDAYDEVNKILEEYDKKKVCKLHIEDDLICLKKFENKYFDWVYLDTTHTYEQTINELEILKDKMKVKGIISGHDWQPDPRHLHSGVFKAVNEFCKKYKWKIIRLDSYSQWAIKKIAKK